MRPSESLHRPDTQDIGYEEPSAEVWFDPAKDIHPKDLVEIRKILEKQKNNPEGDIWSYYARISHYLRDLDPTTTITPADMRSIQGDFRAICQLAPDLSNINKFTGLALALRDFDPEAKFGQTESEWMRVGLTYCQKNGYWSFLTELVQTMHAIDPTFQPATEVAIGVRQEVHDLLQLSRQEGVWHEFAFFANGLCLIDPTFAPDVDITPVDKKGMIRTLQSFREDGNMWGTFSMLASEMQLLLRRMRGPESPSVPQPLPTTKKY